MKTFNPILAPLPAMTKDMSLGELRLLLKRLRNVKEPQFTFEYAGVHHILPLRESIGWVVREIELTPKPTAELIAEMHAHPAEAERKKWLEDKLRLMK